MARFRLAWPIWAAACVVLVGCSGDGESRGGTKGGSGGKGAIKGPNAIAGTGNNDGFGKPTQPTGMTMSSSGGSGDMEVVVPNEPIRIDQCGADNPAGLQDPDLSTLIAGSGSAGSMRVVYPYEGTVFPRGLLAPTWMWEGGQADFVYVHIKSMLFEYKGCLKPTGAGQLMLPQDIWAKAAGQTLGSNDPYTIELTTMGGGTVEGPVAQQILIAQATLKGSIYYNSYTSMLPGAPDPGGGMALIPGVAAPTVGGSVLRIPPGGVAERFISATCNGCHSLSANGSRMVSQQILLGGFSYQLTPDTPPNPPQMVAGPRGSFGAMYPDGSAFLAGSVAIEIARSALTQGLGAPPDATLYKTDDGTEIPNTGIPPGALMPMFSPDGSVLAFNDFAAAEAHGLAVMDYDTTTHTASNYRVLHMETDVDFRPGWPFVLPDNQAVVFTLTNGTDFSGEGAGLAGVVGLGPASDLYIADIDSGKSTLLARAMGFAKPEDASSDDASILPYKAEDLHHNYFPTVSPVAAGGYFWVFFDSVRHYGNLGPQRQLWGAAIDIAADGSYDIDRSHPAYYLPGQEFGTGNHRAFAALDPCKKDGDTCTSGIDCCGGFCIVPEGVDDEFGTEQVGMCSSDVPMCAKINERCARDADCCPAPPGADPISCIAGFCAVVNGPD